MKEKLELSKSEAFQKISLFVRRRVGKSITDKTANEFDKLLRSLWENFKNSYEITTTESNKKNNEAIYIALKSIKCQFIKWELGGNCRLTDIDNFGFYKDEKYRAVIKGEVKEITERDYIVLQYCFFGER